MTESTPELARASRIFPERSFLDDQWHFALSDLNRSIADVVGKSEARNAVLPIASTHAAAGDVQRAKFSAILPLSKQVLTPHRRRARIGTNPIGCRWRERLENKVSQEIADRGAPEYRGRELAIENAAFLRNHFDGTHGSLVDRNGQIEQANDTEYRVRGCIGQRAVDGSLDLSGRAREIDGDFIIIDGHGRAHDKRLTPHDIDFGLISIRAARKFPDFSARDFLAACDDLIRQDLQIRPGHLRAHLTHALGTHEARGYLGAQITKHGFAGADIALDKCEHVTIHLAFSVELEHRDAQTLLVIVAALGRCAPPADIGVMAARNDVPDQGAVMKDGKHDADVVMVPGTNPRIIANDDVPFLKGGRGVRIQHAMQHCS